MLLDVKVRKRMAYSKAQNEATKTIKNVIQNKRNTQIIKLWLEASSRI